MLAGPLLLVSLPGELSGEVTLPLRERARQKGYALVVASFSGEYAGYLLPPERYGAFPQRTWKDAAIGMGMGFHGEHEWRATDLGLLLRPLLPAGADPRQFWILVTAEDGYRVLLSGSEVFSAADGRGVFLADWRDGKPLGPGSGRYHVVPRADFYIDREVRMVKEIRVGPPGAPR